MMIAAPLINPEITERLKKLTKNPIRKTPMPISMRPTKKAREIARTKYSELPWGASLAIAAATIKESTATGPTAKT